METQKAIDVINSIDFSDIHFSGSNQLIEIIEARETLVELAKSRLPKKPIFQHRESVAFYDYAGGHGEAKVERYADWTCPVCGWFVGEQYVPRKHNQQKSNFCSQCGQMIDWSELDDESYKKSRELWMAAKKGDLIGDTEST